MNTHPASPCPHPILRAFTSMILMRHPLGLRVLPPWTSQPITTQAGNVAGHLLISSRMSVTYFTARALHRSFAAGKLSFPIDRSRNPSSSPEKGLRHQAQGLRDSSPPSTLYQSAVYLSRKTLEGSEHAAAQKRLMHSVEKDRECGKVFFKSIILFTRRTWIRRNTSGTWMPTTLFTQTSSSALACVYSLTLCTS